MAHVILGLLLIAPMSLYDLIKGFEAGVSLFYSASSGSIKRALDGLLERRLIQVASVEPGTRGRKVYRVTDEGRREFHDWMVSQPIAGHLETAALSRLYYLGLLDADDRATVLQNITRRAEEDLAQLRALAGWIEGMEVPLEQRDLAHYQRATLDFGIASHQFAINWFRQKLAEGSPTVR
ncbi:PadR family transcriptional regulator [Tessaracoccus sp. OS52]|uniref:PadR family transcriptional regulator n=1 Tax=Tessaracoccus sp. OS52 TaxID=2886691 RepID=UPI001D12E8DB|nr:PadR family transcriptional regulator [Tessaracoccus sp. OS52]MCC2592402.1 PadR family transcriptional regulator [Tessaracoccus sp. OS52]